jgi:hypothetical protein
MNFNIDNNSSQIISNLSTITGNFNDLVTTNDLATKQNTLISSSVLYGIGSNITLLDYNNIYYNKPDLSTLINSASYWSLSSDTIFNTKLTSNVGIGTSNANSYKLNVNGSVNATTIFYNGTDILSLSSLSNYYTKTATDTLLNSKQNTLTFTSPLSNNANTISIDLSTYLLKTGGNISGKVGIGGTDFTSNLAVTGTSYFTSNIGIGTTDTTTYRLNVSGNTTLGGNTLITGIINQTGAASACNLFSGKVGIGGTDFTSNLAVTGTSYCSGNVGIGTTDTTTYRLNVSGNTNLSTNVLVGGLINQNNSAQSNIFLGPVGIGGTNFTSNLYVAGNCNAAIIGNVGIGTTDTTTYKLNVLGNTYIGNNNTWQTSVIINNTNGNNYQFNVGGSGNTVIGTNAMGIYDNNTAVNNYIMVFKGGNVGIGKTETTSYRLDVSGNTNLSSSVLIGGFINQNNSAQSNIFLGPIGIGGTNFTSNLYVAGNCNAAIIGNVGIGTTDTTTYRLNVSGNTNLSTNVLVGGFINQNNSAQSNIFLGPVGIGTNSPATALQVSGAINLISNPSNPGNNTSASFWNQFNVGATISGYAIAFQVNGTTEMARMTPSGVTINSNITISGNILTTNFINQNNSAQSNIFLGPVGIGGTNFTSNLYVAGNCNAAILGNVGIGTTDTTTYRLNVLGNTNATTIFESGTSLINKYLPLSAGITKPITGDLYFNSCNLNIQLTSINGNNIAIPGAATYFSTSALANDMVIRSYSNLMFLSGPGTAAIYINMGNNVGIGTTSTNTYKLNVNGSVNLTSLYSNGTLINFSSYLTSANLSSTFLALTGGTMSGPLTITTSDGNYQLVISSPSTTAGNSIQLKNNLNNSAYIGYGGSTLSGNYQSSLFLEASYGGASIVFNTGNNTSSSTPRMVINSSGNVGIGVIPTYRLDVSGDARVYNGASATNFYIGNGSQQSSLNLWDIANAAWQVTTGNFNLTFNNGTISPLSLTSRVTFTSNGNVGMGTTLPNASLELYSTTQNLPRIILSGKEFYTGANTSSSGIALLCGVNRTVNRQLWIGDTANLTSNSANPIIRLNIAGPGSTANIDSIATDGLTVLPIMFGSTSTLTTINGSNIYNNGNVSIGTNASFSSGTKLTVTSSSTSQPLVRFAQSGSWDNSNFSLQVSGYSDFGGIRINGADTINTFIQNTLNTDMTISLHPSNTTGGNLTIAAYGSSSATAGNIYLSTANTRRMTINNSGNIGIGTNTITQRFHVQSATPAMIRVETNNNAPLESSGIEFGIPAFNSANSAKILSTTYSGNLADLQFYTTAGTGTNSRMTIHSGGYIGIGTTTPLSQLHIHSNLASTDIKIQLTDATTGTTTTDGCAIIKTGATQDMWIANYENANLQLYTNGSNLIASTLGGEKLRVAFNGNVGIGTNNPTCKLQVWSGIVNITNTAPYAHINNFMQPGSLSIGDINSNYGGGTGQWFSNMAGLLLECSDNTEIAVHDANTRVASLLRYSGDASNQITLGRDMGWGAISNILLNGTVLTTNNLFAGGTSTTGGLRINGTDLGNTIYQGLTTIGGFAANIGFTLRDNNSFNFISYSTAGVYTTIANMSMNGILLNRNVGIGIGSSATPAQTFDINGTTLLRYGGGSTDFSCNQILFGWNGNSVTNSYRHAINTRHSLSTNVGNSIDFLIWNTSLVSTTIPTTPNMCITSAGIGIGITNPSSNLTVAGNALITGTISADASQLNNFKLENQTTSLIFPPTAAFTTTNSVTLTTNALQNGTYTSSSSSNANSYLAFDNNLTNEFTIASAYNASTSYNYSNLGTYITRTSNVSGLVYPGEWIQLQYDKGFCATAFSIRGIAASNLKCPNNFILASSIDSSNWILLSSQVGITDYTTTPTKTFSVYNFTSYNYYRLIVTKTIGDINLSIAELSFTGSLNTTFANNDKFNILLYNTNEKQFPPRAPDTISPADDTTTSSNEIFNILPTTYYKQTLTLNNHGVYTIFVSSTYGGGVPKSLLFDYDLANTAGGAHWASNSGYTPNGGAFTATTSRIGTEAFYGDWIIVKFPYPIVLTRFRFYNRSAITSRAPGLWKCYGSNDGITWVEITDAGNITTKLTAANYSLGYFEDQLPAIFDIPYLYIGWVISSLVGGDANAYILNFAELQIYGKEDIANSYSNVWNKYGSTVYTNIYSNVGIGTSLPKSAIELYSTTQTLPRIILSGTEFYGTVNNSDGIAFLLGTNSPNNRQLWLTESTNLTKNASNPVLRLMPSGTIDCIATNGTSALPLNIGNGSSLTTINGSNIYNNGNVGIGTVPSSYMLDVYTDNSTFNNYVRVRGNTAREAGILLERTGTQWYIQNKGTGFPTSSNNLAFSTPTTSILELTTTGRVGIGIINPYTICHIKGTNPELTVMAQGGSGAKSILNLTTYDNTTNSTSCSLIATDNGSFGASFQINQKTSGANTNTQFTSFFISPTGNVGIGTTDNVANIKLDCRGALYTTNLTVFDSNTISGNNVQVLNNYQLMISAPTATTPAKIQTIQQSVGFSQNLILQENSGGNVGIGTASGISAKLTVNGNARIADSINITGATNSAQSLLFRSTDYNLGIAGIAGNYSSSAAAGDMILRTLVNTNLMFLSGSGASAIYINSNNKIGIGITTSLNSTLNVMSDLTMSASNIANGLSVAETRIINNGATLTNVFGGDTMLSSYWGVSINLNYGGSANGWGGTSAAHSKIYGTAAFTINMRSSTTATSIDTILFTVRPSGNTIVGGSDPGNYKLYVNGTGYLNSTAWTYSSDSRIKTNINDINDDTALQKILAIQPKTYEYIDKESRGSDTVYGFIAQQIQEVIPEAVNIQPEVIPNIYKSFPCSSNIITLEDNLYNLNVNDIINIRTESNNLKETKIIDILPDTNQIIIDKELETDNCFIYGTKVDDFHAIKKEYIYTLNVCATQELYKLIQAQQQQINDLLNRISILESK